MIVDGKTIAREVLSGVSRALEGARTPTLALIIVGNNPVVDSFVQIKKRRAAELGIPVREIRFPDTIVNEQFVSAIVDVANAEDIDGVIVQLPLPPHINTDVALAAIPIEKDVDALAPRSMALMRQGTLPILPPVAGAIAEIFLRYEIPVAGRDVLVVGHGRLVGKPAALLMRHNDAHVTVIDRPMAALSEIARGADIIILGVGEPGILRPEMVKRSAIIIDAGTSEQGGKIIGDADPACAHVAGLLTPVPGGVGPIAVAMIFKNLLILSRNRSSRDR